MSETAEPLGPGQLLGLAALVQRRLLSKKQSEIAKASFPKDEVSENSGKLYMSRIERGAVGTTYSERVFELLGLGWVKGDPEQLWQELEKDLTPHGLWTTDRHKAARRFLSHLVDPAPINALKERANENLRLVQHHASLTGFAADVDAARSLLRGLIKDRKHYFPTLEKAAEKLREALCASAGLSTDSDLRSDNLPEVLRRFICERGGAVSRIDERHTAPWGFQQKLAWVKQAEEGLDEKVLYSVPNSYEGVKNHTIDRRFGYLWEGLRGPSLAFHSVLLFIKMEPELVLGEAEHVQVAGAISALHGELCKELKGLVAKESRGEGTPGEDDDLARRSRLASSVQSETKDGAWTYLDEIIRATLRSYVAGAVLMPYEPFYAAATGGGYDIEALQFQFGVSFSMVAHRLTTLRHKHSEAIDWHLIRADASGAITNSFGGAAGGPFDHKRPGCGLWGVYQAETGKIRTQVNRGYINQTGRPDRYMAVIAKRIHKRGMRYGLAIGCEIETAKGEVVYFKSFGKMGEDKSAWRSPLGGPEIVETGMGCHVCNRSCPQRSHPYVILPAKPGPVVKE